MYVLYVFRMAPTVFYGLFIRHSRTMTRSGLKQAKPRVYGSFSLKGMITSKD